MGNNLNSFKSIPRIWIHSSTDSNLALNHEGIDELWGMIQQVTVNRKSSPYA